MRDPWRDFYVSVFIDAHKFTRVNVPVSKSPPHKKVSRCFIFGVIFEGYLT